MGIKNFNKFLTRNLPEKSNAISDITISSLKGKIIAVDISIYLYKYTCGVRKERVDIQTQKGEPITHIHAIVSKVLSLIKRGILPIIVFDGKATEMKDDVLKKRNDTKMESMSELLTVKNKLKKLLTKLNKVPKTIKDVIVLADTIEVYKEVSKKHKSLVQKTTHFAKDQTQECKEILKALNIPYVEAVTEADPQCAVLVLNGTAFGTMSEDMDLLTFGSTHLIAKVSSSNNKCKLYNLNIILEELKITMDQFIDICILLGCDYTCTIDNIGEAKIYDIIKKYGNIENFIENYPDIVSGKIVVPENFDYIGARNEFKNPVIVEKSSYTWKAPNYDLLHSLLVDKYEYDEENYEKIVNILTDDFYASKTGQEPRKKHVTLSMESDDD